MHTKEDIDNLAANFGKCQKILLALGDENRQHMILEMMKMGQIDIVQENIFDDIMITAREQQNGQE